MEKIKDKKWSAKSNFDVCIVGGAGHIGLPLGVSFANSGLKTVLFDINKSALGEIKSGIFPFKEDNGKEFLEKALNFGKLFVSDSPEVISESDIVIMVVGTPVDEYLSPRVNDIIKTAEGIIEYFKDGQTVILRSTVYPGTTRRLHKFFEEKGKKIGVSFCPERIVEGKAFEEFASLPQIVSAFDPKTIQKVSLLFKRLTKKKIIVVETEEAELAKLFSNTWRYTKFAVANQFYMMAVNHNLDYQRIYKAMTDEYPRNKELPGPGFAAGPCLLKDTMQLAAFEGGTFFLGHSSMLVNENLPNYIIKKISEKVPDLQKKTIGILGMSFKAESDDHRDSLSFKIKRIAEANAKKVLCHDFYLSREYFVSLKKVVDDSDIIILATPHKDYKKIDPKKYKNKIFIDIWDFWGDKSFRL